MKNIKYKIVFWGYPLHTDTLSYVWSSMKKAFEYLGYECYWFDDKTNPKDFNYRDCIFITEGKACNNIPLLKDNIYIVHYLHEPERFLGKVSRLIDMRYMIDHHFGDPLYTWRFDKINSIQLDEGIYYDLDKSLYEKIYIAWATNILPHEINFDARFIERKPIFNFIGSISPSSQAGQQDEIQEFMNECNKNNIVCHHYNPWTNPQTEENLIKLTQESIISPDFRGPKHLEIGLMPCRLFKNISYGQLGLTNSKKVHEYLEETTIFSQSPSELFYLGMKNKTNYDLIKKQMQLVKAKHTYINRIQGLIKIL
jgi:hypothetical protein